MLGVFSKSNFSLELWTRPAAHSAPGADVTDSAGRGAGAGLETAGSGLMPGPRTPQQNRIFEIHL